MSDKLSDEAKFWRDLLAAIFSEVEDGEYDQPYTGTENAPGHAHDVPGVWDSDNGSKAGKPCAWCMTWNRARAALAASPAPAIPAVQWQPIETAPRDGTRILTFNVTPTYDEDERRMVDIEAISVAYWLFGDWIEYPASPRFVQGQKHIFWKPLPAAPNVAARKGEKS
ncbi:hypothetical protein [Burkholderia glumae]|uniref:hypothetical protein n=1 Tax=Burkholderia glumae TaxID=337 RepID=UPI0020CE9CC9|nr:hypothetical protein [Burkholderia glumae]MCQ0033623.1 hypothetical protein [Burkholderia glumae]MCQ0037955.1 hypothetical protein [Burkholderia glumae]